MKADYSIGVTVRDPRHPLLVGWYRWEIRPHGKKYVIKPANNRKHLYRSFSSAERACRRVARELGMDLPE